MRPIHVLVALLVALLVGALPLRSAVTDGLVAHYKFDESSGTVATDSVRGASGNGTLFNFGASPWIASPIGGGVTLDGINDWISIQSPLNNNITTFSFSGWVMANSRPVWATIVKNWGGATVGQFHFGLDAASGQLSDYLTNVVAVKEPALFPTGTWQHVAVTYDGTNHRVYRNGVQVAAATMSPILVKNSNVISFGVKTNDAGTAPDAGAPGWWSGSYDDFGLWNRALSADEIQSIYQNGLSGKSLSDAGAPSITAFSAAPPNVPTGGTTTLSWTVTGATSLQLNGGSFVNQDVTAQSSIPTGSLNNDTTFTLTAYNAAGNTSSQTTVGVGSNVLEPVISEFLAENDTGLRDEDGDREDWIEIRNPNSTYSINLEGYHLTDNPENLSKWTFPSVTIPPTGSLIVFCSEKSHPLHTNFQLAMEGEYLALVKPDGTTILQEFNPTYPRQVPDLSYGGNWYLTNPTPAAANSSFAGPFLTGVTENPPQPSDSDNLVIEAVATPQAGSTVSSVTLIYRVMFNAEVSLPMSLGQDGKYRATIPASASSPGQMLRWRVLAADSLGRSSKWPLFRDAANSAEYLGTVINDPSVSTSLPVIHRFTQDAASIDTATGTRCSIFYNGEFFDNLGIRIRGLTSRSWPKKSHKIEMNSGHRFRFKTGVPRVTEFDLNTTYTDKSYVRSILTSESQLAAGLVAPEIFAVHIRQNSAFYSVALFTENPDEDFLNRRGLDPDGAYYKAPTNNTWDTASTFEKKTRLYEAGNQDLSDFISKLGQSGTTLETTVFDEVDIPAMVNFMATVCITQNIDASDKNHFAYRDTNGNREWRMLPWDLDLTFGPNALNTDVIVYNQNYASHPFIGARPYLLHTGKYNRFLEAMVNTPRTQEMLKRRIRSLTDSFLATNWFENRIDQLVPMLDSDVTLDHTRWGASAHFSGSSYTLAQATNRIKTEYLEPRRTYLNSGGGVSIPSTPSSLPNLSFPDILSNPLNGNQDEEYVQIRNDSPFSADLSGWTMEGQITHTFKPGTVLLSGESLYLSPKVIAFRARATSPKGGERLFVQGDYPGQLSARGGVLTIRAGGPAAPVVATTTYPKSSGPVQDYLRITEVNYAPIPGGTFPAGQYEFIELRNTGPSTLDLHGVKISGGLDFQFDGSAVTSLASGAYVLVVKNVAAFTSRYGASLPVAGAFSGSLDNAGDRIHLVDATGESVLDFKYKPDWYPGTDAAGLTLNTANDSQDYTQWDFATGWKPSGVLFGTPGGPDFDADSDADGLPDTWEATYGLQPTNPDDAILDPDHDGQSSLAEFVAGTIPNNPGSSFRIDSITMDPGNRIHLRFTSIAGRTYTLHRAPAPGGPWTPIHSFPTPSTTGTLDYSEPITPPAQFYKVTVALAP